MGTRRMVLPIVLLAALLPSAARADAHVVVDSGAVRDGRVTLQPAVAIWNDGGPPAVFRLANGADQANVTARLSIKADSTDVDLGTVILAPGEIATITLEASILSSPTSVLRVDVDGDSTLQAFAIEESHRPTASIELSEEGRVLLRTDEPTVVSLQVRQRSWLGVVSSELLHAPVLVETDPRTVEAGDRPWLPGPWWVDVLVVDHAGTETRLTVRRSDLGRDALVALGLVAVVSLAVGLSLRRRSGQAPAD